MKTLIITATIIITAVTAHAGQIDLAKIAKIESSNNPKAYNARSKATGLYQITPICVKDYNNYNKVKYTIDDMFVPSRANSVASWYLEKRVPQMLKHYKKPITTETILTAYNCGIACVGKPLPKETVNYIKKYKGEK